jgi:hypothetical protein
MSTEYQFPTETIDLPSGGKFYDETHPLHSGKVDLKYMTAKEEDILTSSNLIAKGLVFDKLYESLVVTPGTKIDSILTGDINAIMVASRILGYGKDYDIAVTCPACGSGEVITVDLTNFEDRKTTGTAEQVGRHFVVTLPVSGAKVEFQLLTRGMEKAMQKDLDAYAKINSEYIPERTTFFKAIVVSVNGSTDKPSISKFVDQLLVKDAKALREEYLAVKPDINFNFEYTCSSCSNTSSVGLPISTSFFWPDR